MKRLSALVLVLVLAFCLGAPALAADPTTEGFSGSGGAASITGVIKKSTIQVEGTTLPLVTLAPGGSVITVVPTGNRAITPVTKLRGTVWASPDHEMTDLNINSGKEITSGGTGIITAVPADADQIDQFGPVYHEFGYYLLSTYVPLFCFQFEEEAVEHTTTVSGFTDVQKSDYFAAAVEWAVKQGITSGTSTTTFSPFNTCTRGQVATFLWRAKGQPEPTTQVNPFTDVSTASPFYKAILWALENNITTGKTANTFAPQETCSRAQILTFLWRAEGQPQSEYTILSGTFPEYARMAAAWAENTGVLFMNDILPGDPCPRADVVSYLFWDLANPLRAGQ